MIQPDSNTLQGGVVPAIRVPMTAETERAIYVEKMDVLLDFAIQYLSNQ